MNKNPFSFYDFLGYLFPGMVTLILIFYMASMYKLYPNGVPIECLFSMEGFKQAIGNWKDLAGWESTLAAIIFSYITGHLISYFSSVTVENFANKNFQYPSHYLLHDGRIYKRSKRLKVLYNELLMAWKEIINDKSIMKPLFDLIVNLIMFPVTISLFSNTLRNFIIRPLDGYVRNSIHRKMTLLTKRLQLSTPDVNSKADYHRIIMHYVYLNIPNSQRKADNYVAIYGFLRAMTLIACMFFLYIFIMQCSTIEFQAKINWYAILWIVFLFFLCNFLFMAFVKFYRRFTLENYMALLTEKE